MKKKIINMKAIAFLLLITFFGFTHLSKGQSYFDGKFNIKRFTHLGHSYNLYDFSRESNMIKAKYFAHNAYNQYNAWKEGKQILLITVGAFSNSLNSQGRPVGLCVDNGDIITRQPNMDMDGLVVVYNGGDQQGGIAVVDMDVSGVKVGTTIYYPRTSVADRVNFLEWGKTNSLSLFQTQLVFSGDRTTNFPNLYYGDKRERRFLSICRKNNTLHHVVIDAPDMLELNLAAYHAKSVLEYDGFTVLYIMNLDTGIKDVLYAYNGYNTVNFKAQSENRLSTASNLLIYYKE